MASNTGFIETSGAVSALADERMLMQVITGIRPAAWCGLRQLSRGMRCTVSKQLIQAALNLLPLITAGDNLCKRLDELVDGAVVVLGKGRHRWSGKLRIRRLRVFGVPGARIRGRVQLADGSSGTFMDVSFENVEAGVMRIQEARWTFRDCNFECSDPDASAITAVSSQLLLHKCTVTGCDSGLISRPCWIGLLAKGASAVIVQQSHIGPCVGRGLVAIEQAELFLTDSSVEGCEEIGLRLDGRAQITARSSRMFCGGLALHVGSSCTGALTLQHCHINDFEALWGGAGYRPPTLDIATTKISGIRGEIAGQSFCGMDKDEAEQLL